MAVILLNGADRIYLNVLSLFTVLAAGIVTQALSRWLRWWAVTGVLAVGVLALLFGTVEHKSLFAKQLPDRAIWYYYPTLLSQYEQPRVLYLMCHDHGEGVPVDALPACKYWSLQMGYTQAAWATSGGNGLSCTAASRCSRRHPAIPAPLRC